MLLAASRPGPLQLHFRAHLALLRLELLRFAWRAASSQLALALGALLFTKYTEAVVRPKLGTARAC